MDFTWLEPHQLCLVSAGDWLPLTIAMTNLGIAVVYLLIPLGIYRTVRKLRLPLNTLLIGFKVFIVCCGITHLLDAVSMFVGGDVYYLLTAADLATFVTSAAVAIVLFMFGPGIRKLLIMLGRHLMLRTPPA